MTQRANGITDVSIKLSYLIAFSLLVPACARPQSAYQDGVLTYSVDALHTCAAESPPPSLAPQTRAQKVANVAPVNSGQTSSCSDIGSYYRMVSAGKLYGLKRTQNDAQSDAHKASLSTQAMPQLSGALANQPTGTHFSIRLGDTQIHVRSGQLESTYEIAYIR